MKTKPITPYQRLLEDFNTFMRKVRFPRIVAMWTYPKARLGEVWGLNDLYQRVEAAKQLGYDVQLYATAEGLEVKYVQKRPE